MIDVTTNKPLKLNVLPTNRATLKMAYSQVPDLIRVLEREKIFHDLSAHILSVNGGPQMAWIDFGSNGDNAAIQALIDSIP